MLFVKKVRLFDEPFLRLSLLGYIGFLDYFLTAIYQDRLHYKIMKDFIWFKNYAEGVPHTINPQEYNSVLDLFEECVKKYQHAPAFENMGKSISFGELDKLSAQFAAFLQTKANLKHGDRVAIQMPNLLQYPVAMFGALRAGCVVVNTNPLYTSREMKHQLTDSGASAIVILANFAYNLEKILADTSIKTVIITEIGDLLGGLKGKIVNLVVKYVKKMVPSYKIQGAIRFNDTLGYNLSYARPTVESGEVAFLQYTGGDHRGVKRRYVDTSERNFPIWNRFAPGWRVTLRKPKKR